MAILSFVVWPALAEQSNENPTATPRRVPFWEGLQSPVDLEAPDDTFGIFDPETRVHIDTLQRRFSYSLDSVVNSIDTFFVEDRVDETFRGNRLRVRVGGTLANKDESDLSLNVDLNIRLPRTEDRLNIFVESISLDQEQSDPTETDEQVTAGLRVFLFDPDVIDSNFDVGMRFRPKPDPIARLRFSREYLTAKKVIFRPTNTNFWSHEKGFGTSLRFDLERRFEDYTLVRNKVNLTWSEETVDDGDNIRWSESVNLFHTFSRLRGIRGEVRAEGVTSPSVQVEEYRTSVVWRQALYSDWLFYEVSPFLAWKKEKDWDTIHGIEARLEVNFQDYGLESN